MRIISGRFKGLRFPTRNMPHARPTTDRAKEALFNILNQQYYLEDCEVLDLYGGMGSMALEFVSRGAEVTTVDFNRKSIKYIADVANSFGAELKIRQAKVHSYLKKEDKQYDIIFADPPYNAGPEIQELIKVLENGNYLKKDGIFILEHQSMSSIEHQSIVDSRNYGQSSFSFFNFVTSNE